ncbi:MAG: methylated-DNA--[protein]-cysteine S-methyltransferase [Candidatus Micrarchaeia archaeon]
MSISKADLAEKLKAKGLTEFRVKVLLETLNIRKGETSTYKRIAEAIGHPRAYRAVGTALKNNPFPVIIPCHRVIRSDNSLGKYYYGGSKRKAQLLKKERAL